MTLTNTSNPNLFKILSYLISGDQKQFFESHNQILQDASRTRVGESVHIKA